MHLFVGHKVPQQLCMLESLSRKDDSLLFELSLILGYAPLEKAIKKPARCLKSIVDRGLKLCQLIRNDK